MKLLVGVLAGLTLCGTPQSVLAGCNHFVSTYRAPVVVKEVIAVKEVPIYVAAFTPIVSVGYQPQIVQPYVNPGYSVGGYAGQGVANPGYAASSADPCAELRGRVAQMEGLLRQMQAGQRQQAPAPQQGQPANGQPPAPPPEPLGTPAKQPNGNGAGLQGAAAVVTKFCAECHTAGKAKGNVALVSEDGKMLDLNLAQRMKILSVTKGSQGKAPSMPRGKPPLDDASFGALLELVD